MYSTVMKLLMLLCVTGSYVAGSSLDHATKGGSADTAVTITVAMKSSPNVVRLYSPHPFEKRGNGTIPTAVTVTRVVPLTKMEAVGV
ncbi:uncharacterized protein N7511_008060 [Penicillium nucicola]|uniref:uncharacterized protein n=1 Tax=Penicillium nucicola TaxID=1850975 RepID=UPI002544EF3F|nr:uncharacterized protein N7511_008060 [Penicillium nucicola]KAJ5753907.1 hypothetical protein N7511_008060 [Penicillium nucicola]